MNIAIVSIFPEMFQALSDYGVIGRAVQNGEVSLKFFNPRDFAENRHKTVDDRPYGGGPGMLMMAKPLVAAIRAAKEALLTSSAAADDADGSQASVKTIYLSPQGKRFEQVAAQGFAQQTNLIFVAGRYEGVDERAIELEVDEEWSIGDYVLSGGELPTMVMLDAIIRLIPGVLGHEHSALEDSFVDGLLDCPHYTRPEEFEGRSVPPELLGGNHKKIEEWRLKQALGRTWLRRPDMLRQKALSKQEEQLLAEFQQEHASVAKNSSD